MRKTVCLYFKVHLPFSVSAYTQQDVGFHHCYEDCVADERMVNKLADESYLPANQVILSNIMNSKGRFKVSFSISGTALELFHRYRPDVIESFRTLVSTGAVEILAETYYNSLSFIYSKREFDRQVELHTASVARHLGVQPLIFRNTELIYSDQLAAHIQKLGFKGILCEGSRRILNGRTANRPYASPSTGDFVLLLRNPQLSDDIAFRFDSRSWNEYPLTAEKFAEWIHAHPADTEIINLFMDYETFGIHKRAGTGIFSFLEALPSAVLRNEDFAFNTPAETISCSYPKDIYHVPEFISWDDHSAACCIWSENAKQNNILRKIYQLEKLIRKSRDEKLLQSWGRLQAVDYIYFMSDHNGKPGNYFNPFRSSGEVYDHFMSILTDMEITVVNEHLRRNNMHFMNQTNNLY